jgi:molecular chaperone GrpE
MWCELNREMHLTMGDETNQPPSGEGAQPPAASGAQVADDQRADTQTAATEERLKQAEAKAAEHYDAWLRAKAEGDNMRKRSEADVANARKYAVEGFSAELLAVKDALEAALATESESASPEAMRSGVELTLKQLRAAFDKYKISEINPVGEKFDPHRHQAISMVESDAAPNTVVAVLQKGYLLHDRVLRPAMVMVAKAKSEAQDDAPSS